MSVARTTPVVWRGGQCDEGSAQGVAQVVAQSSRDPTQQPIFHNDNKKIQWGKERFSTNGAGHTAYPRAKHWTWAATVHCIQKLTQGEDRM